MNDTAAAPEHDTLLYILSDMVFTGARNGTLSEALAWYFLRRLAALIPAIADVFPLGALTQRRAVADHAPAGMPPELSMALADGIYELAHGSLPETESQVCWRVLAELAVGYPAIREALTPAAWGALRTHLLARPAEGTVAEGPG